MSWLAHLDAVPVSFTSIVLGTGHLTTRSALCLTTGVGVGVDRTRLTGVHFLVVERPTWTSNTE